MDFFTQEEIERIDQYAKQEVVPEKFQELKDTYVKLEYACQVICQNPTFSYHIKKDPRKKSRSKWLCFSGLFMGQDISD